jgi:IclR family acetate operon transcriptional repressor
VNNGRIDRIEFSPASAGWNNALDEKGDRVTEPKDHRHAERVFSILEIFEREKRPLALRELSEYSRIPMSTCHALVHTLVNMSYLYQTDRQKSFYPTRRLLDLATEISLHDPILERVEPILEEIRSQTQETVILGKRQKDRVIYLEVLEGPQSIRYSARAGDTKPLPSTSIGKVILGALKPADLRVWLEKHPIEKMTDNTITSYARLIENLTDASKDGYFVTKGENVADVTAIAVPVTINTELFGIAVAGPSHRMEKNFDKWLAVLRNAQAKLTDQGIAA